MCIRDSYEGAEALTALRLLQTETGEESRLEVDGAFLAIGTEPENAPFVAVAALDVYKRQPQRDTNLFLFQNVHLQTLGFAGALRAAGVPVIGKCPIQVYLKRKSSKCANRLNAVRIAGCCGSAGGVYSHPPLSCCLARKRLYPVTRLFVCPVFRRDGRAAPRKAASCGRCPMIPAKPHTRPNTASRAGLCVIRCFHSFRQCGFRLPGSGRLAFGIQFEKFPHACGEMCIRDRI